jgi:hypothetical protein
MRGDDPTEGDSSEVDRESDAFLAVVTTLSRR